MPARRLTLWSCFGLAVLMAASVGMTLALHTSARGARIGGSFSPLDAAGLPVTDKDLRGRPSALFFGFTSCPDACPTTLLALTDVIHRLGSAADRLNIVFVTLDPERDTPAQLRLYLSNFDPRIRGFTGTPEQVARMADTCNIAYRRVPLPDGSYTLDHYAGVLLFDARGRHTDTLPYGADEPQIYARLEAPMAPVPVRSGRHDDPIPAGAKG